jgi:hypothetical protein
MRFLRFAGPIWLVGVLLASCSAPRTPREEPEASPYYVSRDSLFRYRIPQGWFDATSEGAQANRVVWIVRSDYLGTIVMREVYLDDAARKGLTRGGLLSIARLTSSLEAASRRGIVIAEPVAYDLPGAEACLYELEERGEDRVRAILINVAGKLYAVTAMAGLSLPGESRESVFAAQDDFTRELRWIPAPVLRLSR